MYDLLHGAVPETYPNGPYFEALERLTAEERRRSR
jgi:hypothetical protein